LLLLVACMPVQQPIQKPAPTPIFVPVIVPAPVRNASLLLGNIDSYVINRAIGPYFQAGTGAIYDNFGIVPVERYDSRYQSKDITVLAQVFKFSTRQELDFVLDSELYQIVTRGATRYRGQTIALYLTVGDHRSAIWSSGNILVYIETFIPDFAERTIVDAYLDKYPSDLDSGCFDSEGDERFLKGTTSKVKIGKEVMPWTDVCLRDFVFYRNKQYIPNSAMNEEDGLLEGICSQNPGSPGFIKEYICSKGCIDGACKV